VGKEQIYWVKRASDAPIASNTEACTVSHTYRPVN